MANTNSFASLTCFAKNAVKKFKGFHHLVAKIHGIPNSSLRSWDYSDLSYFSIKIIRLVSSMHEQVSALQFQLCGCLMKTLN